MAPTTFDTELMLHFNGKEESVTVNKSALAGVSSYFRNLFLGNWSERAGDDDKRKRFIIKEEADFDMNAFTMMLHSLMNLDNYLDGGSVEAQTALTILLLSVKYDVPMMQLLNSLNNYSKLELLEVGDALGCWELKDHCLATLTNHDVLNNCSHNSEVICRLSKRTRELLDERTNQLDKKRAHLEKWSNEALEEFNRILTENR